MSHKSLAKGSKIYSVYQTNAMSNSSLLPGCIFVETGKGEIYLLERVFSSTFHHEQIPKWDHSCKKYTIPGEPINPDRLSRYKQLI